MASGGGNSFGEYQRIFADIKEEIVARKKEVSDFKKYHTENSTELSQVAQWPENSQ